jgi:hypothetical protein
MRVVLSLVALLLAAPGLVWANPVVSVNFLNSDLIFGSGSPAHYGQDGGRFYVDDTESPLDTYGFYEAMTGPLVQQTLWADASGVVTGSDYYYEGGTFQRELYLGNGGTSASGFFVAPITSLLIRTRESPPSGGIQTADAYVWYVLGPGVFDEPIAHALGIGRRTTGGTVFADMIAPEDASGNNYGVPWGTYTSPERGAWDGYTEVDLTVPEPSVVVLGALAALMAASRQASLRKRA